MAFSIFLTYHIYSMFIFIISLRKPESHIIPANHLKVERNKSMGRIQHLHAIGLAIVVLLGGQVVLFTAERRAAGTRCEVAMTFTPHKLEKQANKTLETFFKTVKEQTLHKGRTRSHCRTVARPSEDKLKEATPQEAIFPRNKTLLIFSKRFHCWILS